MINHLAIYLLISIVITVSAEDNNYNYDNKKATKNEAPATDFGSLFVILVLCLFFCFAVRHFNDFYTGDTITLVEEGTWKGRYRHRPQYLYLKRIENDFNEMMEQLRESDKKMWHNTGAQNEIANTTGSDP